MIPGLLAWGTLLGMVALSRYTPTFVSVFIILFDIYWLLKSIYLSLHLRSTFSRMQENLKIDWLRKLKELDARPTTYRWHDIRHLVIVPMYKEQYEIVREGILSIAKAQYPKENMLLVLAVEARAGEGARRVAERIEREYKNSFFKFLVTVHPDGLPGEIPGKGSNEAWAGREAKRLLIDSLKIPYDHVLVSVLDADTQVFPHYFSRLTYVFLREENRLRAIYQPVPLFTNNIYQAPALARVISFSSTFWQMIQQARQERLTSFSSQSIPFRAVVDFGFWQKDIVSEDSRVFWQGYLHYHGDFRVVPLLYPVSMDANVAPTFWETMKNTYKQHRRWGWGAENIPYMLCGNRDANDSNSIRIPQMNKNNSKHSDAFVDSNRREGFLYDRKIPLKKKWYWSFQSIEGFHSWATNALMIFALGWLPIVLGGKEFHSTLLSRSLPQITRFIVTLSMVGIASSAIVSVILLPPKPPWFTKRYYVLYCLQWLLIPVTLIFFGSFPGLEAQTRLMLGGKWRLGFWVTPKTRSVSR